MSTYDDVKDVRIVLLLTTPTINKKRNTWKTMSDANKSMTSANIVVKLLVTL